MPNNHGAGASRTAVDAAFYRAAHQLLDGAEIFDDPLAVAILDQSPEEIAAGGDASQFARLMRLYLAMRSSYAEAQIAAAHQRGVRQIVQLGSGLDTFAYRNPLTDTHVFELDRAATLVMKRERLGAAGIAIPDNVSLLPVDFHSDRFLDVLDAAGFEAGRPSIFSWLGVSVYLPEDLVRATIGTLSELQGVELVLDYVDPPAQLRPKARTMYQPHADAVARAGEPWRTHFTPQTMRDLLEEHGWTDIEDLGPMATSLHFLGEPGPGPDLGAHLVHARH